MNDLLAAAYVLAADWIYDHTSGWLHWWQLILLIAVVNGSSPDPERAGGASHAIGRAAMATAVQSLVAIIVVALLFAVW